MTFFESFYNVEQHKPVVGSSSKRIFGQSTSSIPMQVRFRSPPDTPLMCSDPIFVFAHDSRLSSRIISVTRSTRCILDIFEGKRTFAENMMFSLTVRVVQIMLS